MTDKTPVSRKGFSADWLMRGALSKIGDSLDRLTGRRWIPTSSLATSELIERIKKLLDSEARSVLGKGTVVPHNIKLKMQWDKFSTDAEGALTNLERELLVATADHINDSLYYTFAPLHLEVKPDYFTEGVKLFVSFDRLTEEDRDVELNVTLPAINVAELIPQTSKTPTSYNATYIAKFEIKGATKEKHLDFPATGSLSVGRTGANDLMLEDASVSKIHASLIAGTDGQLSVADTGSTNGTFINGQRISYGKATRLVDDDIVKFGVIEVIFENVPRPTRTDDVISESTDGSPESTISIDGIEFKRRESPEPPLDSAPAIPIPDETLEIDSEAAEKPETDDAQTQKSDDEAGETTDVNVIGTKVIE